MTSEAKLQHAFTAGLGIDPATSFDDLRYRQIAEWDSVAHMALIAEIEDTFDVMLETEEVIDMSSYPKAREILGNHGVPF